MRWVWAAAGVAFVVGFGGVFFFQQIQIIINQPDCGVSYCEILQPNWLYTAAAAAVVASETWLVGRLLLLVMRRARRQRGRAST